jgi:hypothetical protein
VTFNDAGVVESGVAVSLLVSQWEVHLANPVVIEGVGVSLDAVRPVEVLNHVGRICLVNDVACDGELVNTSILKARTSVLNSCRSPESSESVHLGLVYSIDIHFTVGVALDGIGCEDVRQVRSGHVRVVGFEEAETADLTGVVLKAAARPFCDVLRVCGCRQVDAGQESHVDVHGDRVTAELSKSCSLCG